MYKITENKFVVYSFLIHDSLLFSINAFILSGVYESTIPPILALVNWSNMYSTYQTLNFSLRI